MGPISQVPGLAGYQQQVQFNENQDAGQLMKLSQLMNMARQRQEMQQYPEDLAFKRQSRQAQADNWQAEAGERQARTKKMQEQLQLADQLMSMPKDHPDRPLLIQKWQMLSNPAAAFAPPQMPKLRERIVGGQIVQEEFQPDGTFKPVGGGERFAKQIQTQQPAPVPVSVMQNGKEVKIDARTGRVIGDAPVGARNRPMSATAQKELIETEEQVQGGQAALDLLAQAKAINDKAMGFSGAGAVASAGSLLPEMIRPEAVDATQNLDNILQSSALPQLKAIFGGMPTEGERKILLDVQGSSSKPPKVRAEIFKRAEAAINNRLKFSQDKAKSLRDGSYFGAEGATPQAAGGGNSVTLPDGRVKTFPSAAAAQAFKQAAGL